MWVAIIGGVASFFGAISTAFKWIQNYQTRKLGAVETGYEAAKDAARRSQLRKKVETFVKTLSPNELGERLRERVRKSRFRDH